jgi:hypothetical protein
MALFCHGVPRLLAVAVVMAGFCTLGPEALARGPDLCLWRGLFHLAACPACGTMRALAAFFHGRWGDALAYNRNVVVTAPLLIALAAKDVFCVLRKWRGKEGKARNWKLETGK